MAPTTSLPDRKRREPALEVVEQGERALEWTGRHERAVDGAANAGVVKVLAAHFGVAPRDIEILRGHTARIKRVEVDA